MGNGEIPRDASHRTRLWLTGTQIPDGGFIGGNMEIAEKRPVIFNMGQILKGLTGLAGDDPGGDGSLVTPASRAADWMVAIQDIEGAWRRGASPLTTETIHAYNVRSTWALARFGRTMGSEASCIPWTTRSADGWSWEFSVIGVTSSRQRRSLQSVCADFRMRRPERFRDSWLRATGLR